MGQKDFEQGLIVGMTVGGGDKSESRRQAIIQDLLFINVPIGLSATWEEITYIIRNQLQKI
jgi:hypothetical protein